MGGRCLRRRHGKLALRPPRGRRVPDCEQAGFLSWLRSLRRKGCVAPSSAPKAKPKAKPKAEPKSKNDRRVAISGPKLAARRAHTSVYISQAVTQMLRRI